MSNDKDKKKKDRTKSGLAKLGTAVVVVGSVVWKVLKDKNQK